MWAPGSDPAASFSLCFTLTSDFPICKMGILPNRVTGRVGLHGRDTEAGLVHRISASVDLEAVSHALYTKSTPNPPASTFPVRGLQCPPQ